MEESKSSLSRRINLITRSLIIFVAFFSLFMSIAFDSSTWMDVMFGFTGLGAAALGISEYMVGKKKRGMLAILLGLAVFFMNFYEIVGIITSLL